jgi:hypothetical protein
MIDTAAIDSDVLELQAAEIAKLEALVTQLEERITARDEVITKLRAKVERLTLTTAQAIAREKVLSKPKGFVNAKKRRRADERVARTAIKEACRV